ncbi:hypothetical protein OIU77_022129 [Salix suchowensis]|uniref:Uncharacterized protein n=1 Tax=Salix suchowensis TaxID=1278906 RepID=A0ABQ8ZGM0_9ROSI|nr:hypothetical protein OIU77_022129 [Salix suchowensis]
MKSNKAHNKQDQGIPVMDPNNPLDDGFLGSKKETGKDPVASSWNPKEPITLLKRNGECSEDEEMRASEYSTGEVSGTKEVRHICTVNMMASLQSQSVEKDSEDNVVDSSQLECNLDNRDTSSSSFTKVKKKKGGKKKNKEAHRPLSSCSLVSLFQSLSLFFMIGSWNVRGLNGPNKQQMVSDWIIKNNLSVVGLMETKVLYENQKNVERGLKLPNWAYMSNGSDRVVSRILVGWDPKECQVTCVDCDQQWLRGKGFGITSPSTVALSLMHGC